VDKGKNIDWSTAEVRAFGSLALKKIHVHVSGQDVQCGTFLQRHTIIHDQVNKQQYILLNDLGSNQAWFIICNSLLSILLKTHNVSSISSLQLENASGCNIAVWLRVSRMVTMDRARSTLVPE
jgi:hypothetical protein